VKPKGGARRGNRNAQTSGCHTVAFRQFQHALALYVRMLKTQRATLRALIPRQPKRIFYEVVTRERCYVRTRRGSAARFVQFAAGHRLADAGRGGQAERQALD
jgi:hypothetical protein